MPLTAAVIALNQNNCLTEQVLREFINVSEIEIVTDFLLLNRK